VWTAVVNWSGVWTTVENWSGVWTTVDNWSGVWTAVDNWSGVWTAVDNWSGVWTAVDNWSGVWTAVDNWSGVWTAVDNWSGVWTAVDMSANSDREREQVIFSCLLSLKAKSFYHRTFFLIFAIGRTLGALVFWTAISLKKRLQIVCRTVQGCCCSGKLLMATISV
jgi:hypothetical protein